VLGAATGGNASSVFNNAQEGPATPPPPAAAANTSEASVSGVSVGGGESDEVDPIAEADVYMAYGRDAQAEEILKESLGKDPNRSAVHAKLLEIYASRKDAKNFEQTALKLKGLTGGTLKLDTTEAKPAGGGLDFDLGGAAEEDDGEKTMLMPRKAAPAPAAAAPDPDATVAMDFDLNLDLGSSKPEPAKAADAPLDLGGLSLDLGTPGEGGGGGNDAKWQEVATKLDLAKAYQEMGDKDGARELLNEVVKEGDAAQKSQAEQMLSGLG